MAEIQIPEINFQVVLQLMIVAGWATALLLIDFAIPLQQKRVTAYLAIAGLIGSIIAGALLWGSDGSTFGGMIVLDNYAIILNIVFAAIGVIAIMLAVEYLPRHGIERSEFYPLILLATTGMMLLGQGTDLIVLFLGLEMLSIVLYILAGFAYPKLSSEESAMKYLLIGAFAAGFLVFGIALVYGATGSSNLIEIASTLQRQTLVAESYTFLLAGAALVTIGFGYKISMVPFHMWTPDVYEGAPTPVTAFMSVGAKIAGFAALTRFLIEALSSQAAIWVPILGALAVVTMLVGNISAIAQTNVKRMLAYSSIGHAGYMLLGTIAAGSTTLGQSVVSNRGIEALLFYMIAYALTNLGAFAVLIALEQRGEAAWDLADLAGLWQRNPWLAAAMAVCMLSLAGVPLTAGFFGKLYIFSAAWEAGQSILAVVGVITSVIAAFFYLRIIAQMFMSGATRQATTSSGIDLRLGLGIAVAGILLFGLLPTPIVQLVQQSVLAVGR
jgi:NADH-quinone oxidoreductase subunit N